MLEVEPSQESARIAELERRLALVEDLLHEILNSLPREDRQPACPQIRRKLRELDGMVDLQDDEGSYLVALLLEEP